jgi:ATP-dependent DNA ligase
LAFAARPSTGAQLYAFDMLAGDGEDYRRLPLLLRKANLARLLSRPADGIFVAEYEQGEIYSARPAAWALSELSRNASIMAIAPAATNTGSRSRTARTRRTTGSGIS